MTEWDSTTSLSDCGNRRDDACSIDNLTRTLQLLHEQYQFTETYCNSLIAMYSSFQRPNDNNETGDDEIEFSSGNLQSISSIEHHQEATRNLIRCMKSLTSLIPQSSQQHNAIGNYESSETISRNSARTIELLLRDHLQRSQRVLKTIEISTAEIRWHPNGLPRVQNIRRNGNQSVDFNCRLMVALATLRASIRSTQNSLVS
jgi:hypothetical protein